MLVKKLFVADKRYETFNYLYCKECQSKAGLNRIWEVHSEKLPAERSVENLMLHWDELKLSWNCQDILGCILPNKKEETVVINAQRFLMSPVEHWNSVHKGVRD